MRFSLRHRLLTPEISFSWRRRAPALMNLRITNIAAEYLNSLFVNRSEMKYGRMAIRRTRIRSNGMPRRLENDKWLFRVTLGLCLLGAVMIFSASAVTAENEYHHSYYFLVRQSAWLLIGLAGMFFFLRPPHRQIPAPGGACFGVCIVGFILSGAFFSG